MERRRGKRTNGWETGRKTTSGKQLWTSRKFEAVEKPAMESCWVICIKLYVMFASLDAQHCACNCNTYSACLTQARDAIHDYNRRTVNCNQPMICTCSIESAALAHDDDARHRPDAGLCCTQRYIRKIQAVVEPLNRSVVKPPNVCIYMCVCANLCLLCDHDMYASANFETFYTYILYIYIYIYI